jgi:hypothetical protein
MEKLERTQVLALKELGYSESGHLIDSMHKREMANRTRELHLASADMAEQLAAFVGGKLVGLMIDSATEWTIVMEPIRNLKIYYALQRYSPEFDDEVSVFYGKETRNLKIPIDDLYDFTRLCANALVRAAENILPH